MFFISRVDKVIYISLAVSYFYQCNAQHTHLGRHRAVVSKTLKFMRQNSKTYMEFIRSKLPNRPKPAQTSDFVP